MVPFAGWEMPVQFSGLIQEHKAVRNSTKPYATTRLRSQQLESVRSSTKPLVQRAGLGEREPMDGVT